MSMQFGAFGKMPSIGDFFHISPAGGFVQAWDPWVQQALLTGAQAFGTGWDAAYMSAPIWRFSLSAGLAGPAPVLGVLMPSIDRVGRRFPLTLMTALPPGPVVATHLASDALFERLEDLALAALEDDMTRDRLALALEGMSAPIRRPALTRFARAGQTCIGIGSRPLHAGLAAAYVGEPNGLHSLWTSELDGVSRMMLCGGWPGLAEVPALFDLSAGVWNEEVSA